MISQLPPSCTATVQVGEAASAGVVSRNAAAVVNDVDDELIGDGHLNRHHCRARVPDSVADRLHGDYRAHVRSHERGRRGNWPSTPRHTARHLRDIHWHAEAYAAGTIGDRE